MPAIWRTRFNARLRFPFRYLQHFQVFELVGFFQIVGFRYVVFRVGFASLPPPRDGAVVRIAVLSAEQADALAGSPVTAR
ncbi:hypothetical protein [Bosea beijingensis]|uniref:hypothetical protein n=1 Tax=Bosea beijingensis TaxID=3068632 RepID=UPI0027419EBB|nr:hypothetical protein [Bosea sp. REN20]